MSTDVEKIYAQLGNSAEEWMHVAFNVTPKYFLRDPFTDKLII